MRPSKHPGKAVVLLSGGLHSATTLAIAKDKGHELYAVTFDYQQRHARELESARSIASALAVKKHLIIDFSLRDIGGSALTSDLKVPKKGIRDAGLGVGKRRSGPSPKPQSPIPVTYVPARNTIFLSFALAWARPQASSSPPAPARACATACRRGSRARPQAVSSFGATPTRACAASRGS